MEALGDDDEVVGIEYFARADDGVECAEPGVVEHDICRINAGGNQVFTHGDWFVVALQRVIAA